MIASREPSDTLWAMSARLPWRTLFIALLCVSVLFVRGGGMHLHLCFDGQEAPAEVHWADTGIHDDAEHASESHDDRDVGFGEGMAKTAKTAVDYSLAILAAAFLLSLILVPSAAPLHSRRTLVPTAPRYFLPPLRGPPA